MGKPFEPALILDAIGAFQLGMNSDVPPVDLPRNQAAFITNGTCRGNYITHRPPYQDIALSYSSEAVSVRYQKSLWQGACFYKPDFGPESLIASIGGRIFEITPATTTAEVTEITPPDGPNSATAPQAWLWQGENYIFINNGQDATIIYDNQSTRRLSQGELIATISVGGALPDPGTLQVTLTAPYAGPYNAPLNLNSATGELKGQVQVQELASGYGAILTNVNDVPGTIQPAGSSIIIPGSYQGFLTGAGSIPPGGSHTFSTSHPYTGPVGGQIRTGSPGNSSFYQLTVTAKTTSTITLLNTDPTYSGFQINLPSNTPFHKHPSVADVVVGTLQSAFTAPQVGGTVPVILDSPYTGPSGQTVTINGATYTIAPATPPASNQVYLLNLAGEDLTVLATDTLNFIPQLPPGRMGVYGLGRNWISLPDGISYLGSDIVGSSSGTQAYNYRDAILNVTENSYLAGGGVFRVPSSGQIIQGMIFPATLDSSLGQGPLQVLTPDRTFSCNAPVDRTTWQDMINPIQTQSLVTNGGLSHYSTVIANGDIWFRAVDGIRSLILGRVEFRSGSGNTPQSVEMNRILMADNRELLGFSSAVVFDNRLLMTATPTQSGQGVYHTKLIALNFDPVSSLQNKQPLIYDGAWEVPNILQIVKGKFGGSERCFAFVLRNPDAENSAIDLVEIKITDPANRFDNGTTAIQFSAETSALFYQPETTKRVLMSLDDGEMFVDKIPEGATARFSVYYRPDYDQTWRHWHSWETTAGPTWQPRMGLGKPETISDTVTGRPFLIGYSFQLLIICENCVVMGGNFYARTQPEPQFAPPLPGIEALTPPAI